MRAKRYTLSADGKHIDVRDLPDVKVTCLRDPALDGPTGEKYTLGLTRAVPSIEWSDTEFVSTVHKSIKARRIAIRRQLRRQPAKPARQKLQSELHLLADAETQFFGIRHRSTAFPLNEKGKRFVPKTARGRSHVPVVALPLNARGKRHVPSPRDIVEAAVFRRFAEKGNLPIALAKLAAINPEKYGAPVRQEAQQNSKVRRAVNRVGSDVSIGWPPTKNELLVLENFYATKLLSRPLFGLAYDQAVARLQRKTNVTMTVDQYRRILRKFFLA